MVCGSRVNRDNRSMRIGVLTSGGDAPGLNAVIRSVVLNGERQYGLEFIGIRDGWRGLVEADFQPLKRSDVKGIAKLGGTILGSSRTNPFEGNGGIDRINSVMSEAGMDALLSSVVRGRLPPQIVSPKRG